MLCDTGDDFGDLRVTAGLMTLVVRGAPMMDDAREFGLMEGVATLD